MTFGVGKETGAPIIEIGEWRFVSFARVELKDEQLRTLIDAMTAYVARNASRRDFKTNAASPVNC